MNQFYVSIIFLGIVLMVISLVWIAYDRKKAYDYSARLDEKKQEIVGIIEDAEQMIDEMNKFSDYIVTQMELKNEEMSTSLKCMEDKIKNINSEMSKLSLQEERSEMVVNGSPVGFSVNAEILPLKTVDVQNLNQVYEIPQVYKQYSKTKEKVIPINPRHKEVLKLAQCGFDDTEIAKRLNMGKGEVQLIIGMNK